MTRRLLRKAKAETSAKLRLHFEKHFSSDAEQQTPHELTDAPIFIRKLQEITLRGVDTGPPNRAEILGVIKKLKREKSANDVPAAYLKHLTEYDEFVNEMVLMYSTI